MQIARALASHLMNKSSFFLSSSEKTGGLEVFITFILNRLKSSSVWVAYLHVLFEQKNFIDVLMLHRKHLECLQHRQAKKHS